MQIGTLKKNDAGVFVGRIDTLQIGMAIVLTAVEATKETSPKYEVMARGVSGASVKVGALWEQTSNSDGQVFLQGKVEDPSMEKPLYIAAFTRRDGSLAVNWSKPRASSTYRAASDSETELPGNDTADQHETEDQNQD